MNGAEVATTQRTSIWGQYVEWQEIKEKTLACLRSIWHWLTGQNQLSKCEKPKLFLFVAWDQICLWLCSKKFTERYCMLKWVKRTIPKSMVTNFREDWKDGTALCALVNALVPGTCPRYDLLDKSQELSNIELGLNLAKLHLKVKADVTAEDFQIMMDDTEIKIVKYISILQLAHEKRLKSRQNPAIITEHPTTDIEDEIQNPTCFARGMGIILAHKGQKAWFNIYLHANQCMDIVVEIEGPENDFCTKRITIHSPRKTQTIDNFDDETTLSTGRQLNMDFEYEVMQQMVAVGYTPQNTGDYKVSIIYRGQHIRGSPYNVWVDEPSPNSCTKYKSDHGNKMLGVNLSRQDSGTLTSYTTKFGEPILCDHPPTSSKIIRRKVLRSIVYRNGEQVILHGDEPLPPDPRAWSSGTSVQIYDSSNESTTSECGNFEEDCRSTVSTPNTETAEYDLLESLPEDDQLFKNGIQIDKIIEEVQAEEEVNAKLEERNDESPSKTTPKLKLIEEQEEINNTTPRKEQNEHTNTKTQLTTEPNSNRINGIPRQRCSSLRMTNGVQHSATRPLTPRIPNELINEWGELWNADGEGIVKTRVKALESNLQNDKQKKKYLSQSTSNLQLSNMTNVQIKLIEKETPQ